MMKTSSSTSRQPAVITKATVVSNPLICSQHHRLIIRVKSFPQAEAGQFIHLICPEIHSSPQVLVWPDDSWPNMHERGFVGADMTVRRAFSIAGVSYEGDVAEITVLYRVVGRGTFWMSRLNSGDEVDLLGPLGNSFTIKDSKKLALLIAGGIGFPPMIFWAEKLSKSGIECIVFCGAQSRSLLPLDINPHCRFSNTGTDAVDGASEFAKCGAKVVISTDDGTLGYRGFITGALENYVAGRYPRPQDVSVYTCGPDAMMRRVAQLCEQWGFDCQLCMERSMACGMGTCQSCVVPVRDDQAEDGWRYKLCCTDGPVFDRTEVIWV